MGGLALAVATATLTACPVCWDPPPALEITPAEAAEVLPVLTRDRICWECRARDQRARRIAAEADLEDCTSIAAEPVPRLEAERSAWEPIKWILVGLCVGLPVGAATALALVL